MFSKFKVEIFLIIIFLSGISPNSKYIEYVSLIYLLISFYAYFFFIYQKNHLSINRTYIFPIIFLIFLFFQFLNLPASYIHFISLNSFVFYDGLYQSDWYSVSLHPLKTLKYLVIFLICFFIIIITPKLINTKRTLKRVFEIIFWIGALHSLIALSIYFFDKNILKNFLIFFGNDSSSFSGLFLNRNNFSFYMVLFFIISVSYYNFYYKFFLNNKKTKFFNFILSDLFIIRLVIILFAITIVLTKSRAGNLTFMIVLFFLFLLDYLKNRKLTFITKTIITIFILDIMTIGFFIGFDKVIDRYAVISLVNEENRLSFFDFGIRSYFNYWFWGYGLGSFETLFRLEYPNFNDVADHVHNDFIEYLGELGLFGTFILLIIFINFLFKLKKNHESKLLLTDIRNIIFLTIVACIVHGNFDFALHKPAIIFFVSFNLSLGLCCLNKNIRSNTKTHFQ